MPWLLAARVCRKNLPRGFAAGNCGMNLPSIFAARNCRRNFQQEFNGGIFRSYLPQLFPVKFVVAVFRGFFVYVSKSFFVYVRKFFIRKKTFYICEQDFLICEIFFINSVPFCYYRGSYGEQYIKILNYNYKVFKFNQGCGC